MTDREREILIDCLERRRLVLDTLPPVLPDDLAIVTDLIGRLKANRTPAKAPAPATTVTTRTKSSRAVVAAQEQIERIVEMCEDVGNYDSSSAQDFASSVQEKAESIGEWIDKNGDVTEKQQEALDNMESGISRWIR